MKDYYEAISYPPASHYPAAAMYGTNPHDVMSQPRGPMMGLKEEPLSSQLGSVRNWMQTQITPVNVPPPPPPVPIDTTK